MKKYAKEFTVSQLLEEVIEMNSVSEVEKHLEQYKMEKPNHPRKPSLPTKISSALMAEYAENLKAYEVEEEDWKLKKAVAEDNNAVISLVVEEYVKQSANFYSVPTDKQQKVWSLAWQRGHAYGYSDVYSNLCDLVDLFN